MANLLSAALPSSDEEDDDYDPTRDLAEAKKREKEELLDGGRGRQGVSGRRTGGLAGEEGQHRVFVSLLPNSSIGSFDRSLWRPPHSLSLSLSNRRHDYQRL